MIKYYQLQSYGNSSDFPNYLIIFCSTINCCVHIHFSTPVFAMEKETAVFNVSSTEFYSRSQ